MQICPYNQAVCINLNLRLRRARANFEGEEEAATRVSIEWLERGGETDRAD